MDRTVGDEAYRRALSALEIGQVRNGVIADIRNFGVFVDLGDVEGVITNVNLSWGRFDHPADIVNVGQNVAVVVLAVDLERMQLSLSLRELQPKPLLKFARTCLGKTLQAEVSKVLPFGVFVRPDVGIEGLIPAAEFERKPAYAWPSLGETILVQVEAVNIVSNKVEFTLP
ncbi:S1 RNA-binding domain-containing protein [Spongiactinospora sp. TRM90649]|uniref:S1 RNA-binding domain-containing protein n=1 Tax=Spongiactinospora sp. TRM90649 TaxID=3031114 RepID=UPI0023F91C21|nr:S1 RNA-binding domain-containing protein [Spongiactinospora sp. TRM90649]MDF5753596.1 S1 RNA-binding domain-containing protein [Spongiactinospora sp. TRM90649]